ncbi:MAG: sulfite exporter TauE/SafE family protein [Flavobacteriaceae bacterium]|nr:sulfite exporter TauE/SafE family protein [Flavobacteriaceae bacterium]
MLEKIPNLFYMFVLVQWLMYHGSSHHDTEIFPLVGGALAAFLHVVSGPDHLAAVAPFAIESRHKAWKVGAAWGIGHLLGMLLIGMLFVVFQIWLPLDRISEHSEFLVGLTLVVLGLWVFFKIFHKEKSELQHHSENEVWSIHSRSLGEAEEYRHVDQKQHWLAALSIGVLHGVAGISHFVLFAPVLGLDNTLDSLEYMFGFACGTILMMTAFSLVLGNTSILLQKNQQSSFFKALRLAAALFAIVIGIYWMWV